MRMIINIQPPIPPSIDMTYLPFGYGKFGLCCWTYDQNCDGIVEWINTMNFITESKMDGVTGFRYFLRAGLYANLTPLIHVPNAPPISIGGFNVNPLTGAGLPLVE